MIAINLMPWRTLLRQKQMRNLRVLLSLGMGCACLIVMTLHVGLAQRISTIELHNHQHQAELTQLYQQTQAIKNLNQQLEEFNSGIRLLRTVVLNQVVTLEIFNKILTATPRDVSFSQLVRQGRQIFFTGSSESARAISQLVKYFPVGVHFQKTQINEIKTQPDARNLLFRMQLTQAVQPLIEKVTDENAHQ